MATMIDSVTPAAIPKGTSVVAGYIDGPYGPGDPFKSGWNADSWSEFPGSEMVTITIYGAAGARVYDIEQGDGTPSSGAAWCKSEIVAGRRPTLYFSAYLVTAIVDALANAGVARSQVDFWVANYNDEAVVPSGYVAHQYLQDQPGVQGSFIDYSVTNGVWPAGPIPQPLPIPTPGGTTVPASTDVVDAWFIPGTNGASGFSLHADGGLFSFGNATDGQITYVAVANDGSRYHFGPNGDHAVFSYPALTAAARAGPRYFLRMVVLAYNGVATEN